MAGRRLLIHSMFLLLLPVLVAAYAISTAGAIALVLFALLWRVAISLSVLLWPPRVPVLELESIPVSHFVEKVRWCLDRLGVEYDERPVAGIFGVVFTGRTVPQLKVKTGIVRSVIGESADILRYLWGRYAAALGDQAEFLEPTEERLAMERRIDRCGAHLQVWVYYHLLPHRDLTLRAWGRDDPSIALWQRLLLPVLFPAFRAFLNRAFRISDEHYAKVVRHIEELLQEVESILADGRHSLLGGDRIDYVDLSFAAISGLWIQPAEFGNGVADAVRIDRGRYPLQMGVDVERWCEQFPRTVEFVERLYREERRSD